MKIKLEESGEYITSSNIREAICSGDQKRFRVCMGSLPSFIGRKWSSGYAVPWSI